MTAQYFYRDNLVHEVNDPAFTFDDAKLILQDLLAKKVKVDKMVFKAPGSNHTMQWLSPKLRNKVNWKKKVRLAA